MVKKITGISNEFVICPGESLKEILADRNMMQKELALRTNVTEKHISMIISGASPISVSFAKKLEYALGIDSTFWINLQAKYDKALVDIEDMKEVSDLEIGILHEFHEIKKWFISKGYLQSTANKIQMVIELRKVLGVSNLELIKNVSYSAQYRMQDSKTVNSNILFAWVKMCELETESIKPIAKLDIAKLESSIPKLKNVMFSDVTHIQDELTKIFCECGIKFTIVEHFAGAPVQGFIKRTSDGSVVLCMTTRRAVADIFWFSLMHEIAHILNGDIKESFVDYDYSQSEIEKKADRCASEFLINTSDYGKFINKKDFSIQSIAVFAQSQNVQPYIVIGRLKKEKRIPYSWYTGFVHRYHLEA
jgi:HTH-type transcriptional regulator / antitoxin HigA